MSPVYLPDTFSIGWLFRWLTEAGQRRDGPLGPRGCSGPNGTQLRTSVFRGGDVEGGEEEREPGGYLGRPESKGIPQLAHFSRR